MGADVATSTGIVALSCDRVTKVFPVIDDGLSWRVAFGFAPVENGIVALKDVSLSVSKGKLCGVLGHNGAGKSTLLRVAGGVYPPTAGTVCIDGRLSGLFELGGMGNRQLTGRKFASRSLMLQGAHPREIPALIEGILDFSELGAAFEDKIYTYSSGMAARLYFACATALQHDVYLIDELLSVGDEHFQAKCWGRMRERLGGGASGLLVTHDWSAVIKLCENSYIMSAGSLVEFGRSDRTVARYLNLERPSSDIARIIDQGIDPFVAESMQDALIPIRVEISEHSRVAIAFSIELLRIGIGWETLIMQRSMLAGTAPGTYDVWVRIPRLPLPAGEYSLNIWLHDPEQGSASASMVPYDARSWTYGNGLCLVVRGEECEGVTRPPLHWNLLHDG